MAAIRSAFTITIKDLFMLRSPSSPGTRAFLCGLYVITKKGENPDPEKLFSGAAWSNHPRGRFVSEAAWALSHFQPPTAEPAMPVIRIVLMILPSIRSL
jgi:hypothetical protein